ncbi:YbfB/YjiJ family MFS transporter [Marinobacter nanhaiticus D15-8W]|uniref:MFS transporter n=1 Tax=Marinobacter nanhaiticus D15-8W TaxID=626887 RepID=N6X3Y8_9GAMM|nr:MFS transporter [Marinobacter nanhaiticus]ENO15778.1 MFS transporter [Marinobacter nanhaiticus D15-8W]BES73364.1 YbfB/YjiJ family MFS transporter [Marinobacter nanhaiticus D15-8W]
MSPALRLGAVGFGLIAVCYGFARFAFGLFLPQIDSDLALGSTLAGVIAGGSFLSYCIAIVASAYLTERVGPRAVSVGAALVAAAGMAGIALAPDALSLAGAVMLAGSSTGLASPPMAVAVAAAVRRDRQDATNTVINAGTSAGVALSGPIALLIGGQWRLAFVAFAVVALGLAVAAARSIPAAPGRSGAAAGVIPPIDSNVARLIGAAFLMGAASTALWSFGGKLATLRLGWEATGIGALWVAIGAAGITGGGAGALVSRFGIDRVHWVFLATMAAGILEAGASFATPVTTLGGGALFGAAYVMLTGVYLVWGVTALPHRPATGLMVAFLTIAIGQTVGAPVFGFLLEQFGPDYAVVSFACLGLVAGLARANRVVAQLR